MGASRAVNLRHSQLVSCPLHTKALSGLGAVTYIAKPYGLTQCQGVGQSVTQANTTGEGARQVLRCANRRAP